MQHGASRRWKPRSPHEDSHRHDLSPDWVAVFTDKNIEAIHWATVGAPDAKDSVIMQCARENGCIVFTHDLDFGTALALTKAAGPSVIQLRSQNIMPSHIASTVVSVIEANREHLIKGSLIVIDEARARIRILPL